MREVPKNRGSSAFLALMATYGVLVQPRTYSPDHNPEPSILGEKHYYPNRTGQFKSAWGSGTAFRGIRSDFEARSVVAALKNDRCPGPVVVLALGRGEGVVRARVRRLTPGRSAVSHTKFQDLRVGARIRGR
jgi:hypothetical protein